jgi:hypothetical protein
MSGAQVRSLVFGEREMALTQVESALKAFCTAVPGKRPSMPQFMPPHLHKAGLDFVSHRP